MAPIPGLGQTDAPQPPRQDSMPGESAGGGGGNLNNGGGGGPNNRWYNPLPDPYGGVFPSNGAEVYNPFGTYGGMMPGGMMAPGMMGMMPGMMYGGMAGPGVVGNVWGGYDTGHEGDGNRIPGYGYNSVVDASVFQKSLSGNGELRTGVGEKIYQDHYVQSNDGFAILGLGAVGGFIGALGTNLLSTKGNNLLMRVSRRAKIPPFLNRVLTIGGAVAGGTILAVKGMPFVRSLMASHYSGLDYADNGNMDGSWTVQRNYDVGVGGI
jgi:hypothetical protein